MYYNALLFSPMQMYTCRKFNKTIEILQGDIESLETDKSEMEKKLDQQARKSMMPDIAGHRYGNRGSPFASPFGSPFISRRVSRGLSSNPSDTSVASEGGSDVAGSADQQQQNPLLLARVRESNCEQRPACYYVHVCTVFWFRKDNLIIIA